MRNLWIFAALAFVLDQGSKTYVLKILDLANVRWIEVFPPYLNFHMAWNTGVNFGLFGSGNDMMRWVLSALGIVISGFVIHWIRTTQTKPLAFISAGLLVGGALGNVIDRVIYGAVVDFLNTSCCGFQNPYAFNVADIFVFGGAFGLLLFAETNKTP